MRKKLEGKKNDKQRGKKKDTVSRGKK